MPPPNRIDPLEALRVLTTKMNRHGPETFPLEEAPGGFLAEAVECASQAPPLERGWQARAVAARDGYALPAGLGAGDLCRVLGTRSTLGPLDPDGFPVDGPEAPGRHGSREPWEPSPDEASIHDVWRVETGAPVPEGFDRVLEVLGAVVVGRARVRLERIPAPGDHLALPARPRFEAGTALTGRVRSGLARGGVRSVRVRPPFTVAVAMVGDDIADARSAGARSAPEPAGERREDATGPWLEDAITKLGLKAIAMGVLGDSPDAVRDAILHVRGRADVLILGGGIGDGLTDRTVESVQRFEAHILFHGLDLAGSPGLFFAKTLGIDILGIPGKPLEAGSAFDLFVRPALLARLGADRPSWDWSRALWPVATSPGTAPTPHLAGCSPGWRVQPAALAASSLGDIVVRPMDPAGSFAPQVPGQEGWVVFPGSGSASSGPSRAYFQPLAPG